ncbi:MAG: molecular chaperone [Pusillimonas sp.]|uniref:fimbrial biogenesis chaperone n=1 Tax=Rhodanobacter sp. FW021-MT20 TaxID=1162282 RepID=UPI000260E3EC|nr:fimbria/pilus periplasmic chaperone [Rhodanobacter sp. 115]EIL87892.1 P pilus assembly protein, chaperone PapD [Rhodanobacter sp. 115]TAM06222.1 MAG: molecular chaperone [Pusillimonas sp.]
MNKPIRVLVSALVALGCALSIAPTRANVIIAGTRVIFPAKDGEVTVRLTNDNAKPALVEAWIDNGDPRSTPDKVETPFLITPPLFRMDAHKDQSLRILFTHSPKPLPTDRESVFWLNVLEIPPKPNGPQAVDKNYLQLAIRSRLKLFYRPAGLAGDPMKAPAQLSFKATMDGTGHALQIHNPTPYYITIVQLSVNVGGKAYEGKTGMVAPMSDLRLDIPKLQQAPSAGSAIQFNTINDYGANVASKSAVSP